MKWWLISKIFAPFAPIFHFIGDHRYGAIAIVLLAAAALAWMHIPVVGRNIAKVFVVLAVAAGFFDWGYSYRADIDREARAREESARIAAELKEFVRREAAIKKSHDQAVAAARAEVALEADRAKVLREADRESRANDKSSCLPASAVMRLDKIR